MRNESWKKRGERGNGGNGTEWRKGVRGRERKEKKAKEGTPPSFCLHPLVIQSWIKHWEKVMLVLD